MYIYVCVFICICIYMYIYIYILYTYMHTKYFYLYPYPYLYRYGDIVPVNNNERLLAIFIGAMGASVFGYVVARISSLVQVCMCVCVYI
jgi:hypothetical protein